jgi:hypothetical protein
MGNKQAVKKRIAVLVTLIAIGVSVTAIQTACDQPAKPSEKRTVRQLTRTDFDQLREGMLYPQITEVLGGPGDRILETRQSDLMTLVSYQWSNSDGSSIWVDFKRVTIEQEGNTAAQSFEIASHITSFGLR